MAIDVINSVLILGREEIARYPFLTEAGNYLREKGFTLEQFAKDEDLRPIVDLAVRRIETAADGKIFNSDFSIKNLDVEVFSFLIAVVLLKQSGMNTLIKRFSLAEARRAERFLERDLNDSANKTSELAIKIIRELFSMNIAKNSDYFVIPASDYLKHAVHFHEQEWKLVNRLVDNGSVFLTAHETVRLIRKELDNFISSKIRSSSIPDVAESFRQPVEQLLLLAKKFNVQIVETTEYPPCIKHAMEIMNKGENLPHSGRFMLATYLLNKGQSIEEIAPLFKNAPDYNEKITLYQLKHLAGNFGSGTKYACPSCEKLRSENLCFAIPECNNIINPLQFGRKKVNA
ncbi:DNA primase large subunit PriL [Candidatus Nitrosotenuis uzonensis]|uniref:DNA primase large subunit PriL n=1 Tax=Candidatus Nitrosotenuis uzonensis TaxID=1407055 RepID=A0A812F1U5_9ARCH|nr:DNA primase large subunit PriL [Candidatus Nitrosotenuis uzonensis]